MVLAEQKRLRLINQLMLLVQVILIVVASLDLLEGDNSGFILTLLTAGFTLLIWILQFLGFRKISQILLVTGLTTIISICSVLYGKALGGEFIFFPISVFVLMYFDKGPQQTFFLIFLAINFIITQILQAYFQSPLSEKVNPSTYYYTFSASMISSFLATYLFVKENTRFEKLSSSLLSSLQEKNEELKGAQQKLKRQNEVLENTNKELKNFAYIASHDLREPLQTIIGYTGLLEKKYTTSMDEKGKQYIEYIKLSTNNLNQLIVDLLAYSRINTQIVLSESITTIHLVNEVVSTLKTQIDQSKATIEIGKLPEKILGKPSQLRQVFQNLITNALKFQEKANRPFIQIKGSNDPQKAYWEFCVIDNGIGIPDDQQENIFQIFTKLNNRQDYEGTGIGLALCKKVIEQHGGEIWVEANPENGGSIFHFTIAKPEIPS